VTWDPTYHNEVEQLEPGGINTISKGHFTYLYTPARKRAFTKKNILAGWAKSGLFTFNPGRVLRDAPKSVATLYSQSLRVEYGPMSGK
jgi:hypothetical protein